MLTVKNDYTKTHLSIHGLFLILLNIPCMRWTNKQALVFIIDEGQILQWRQIVSKVSQTACP